MVEVSVGAHAPTFELPDERGLPWSLSGQLETGPVVLVFYRGDWCPYCNGQMASIARKYEGFERRGVQVVGVSVDPPEHNLGMRNKLLLPFSLLSDARGELARVYGLWNAREGIAIPATVAIDRTGEVHYLYVGTDLADRPPEEEVLAALKGIGKTHKEGMESPEVILDAADARRESVRPDRRDMPFEDLFPYYHGVRSTTIALERRFSTWRLTGGGAARETARYRERAAAYQKALEETARLREG